MTAIAPLTRPASNDDIAAYLEQVHDCQERNHLELISALRDHALSDERVFEKIDTRFNDGSERFDAIDKTLIGVTHTQQLVANSLGFDTLQLKLNHHPEAKVKPKRKPIFMWTQWELLWKGALGLSGFAAVLKFSVFIFPLLGTLGLAVWNYLLK